MSTMTIGASNVFAFVGWDGPYFPVLAMGTSGLIRDANGDPEAG